MPMNDVDDDDDVFVSMFNVILSVYREVRKHRECNVEISYDACV